VSPCSECQPCQVDKERATLAQQMAALQETHSSEEARGDAALVSWGAWASLYLFPVNSSCRGSPLRARIVFERNITFAFLIAAQAGEWMRGLVHKYACLFALGTHSTV
jgi:hypothetical protein